MKSRLTTDTYNFYEGALGNRYYVDVEVPTPLGATAYFFALIDTGADDLVIPTAYLADFFPGGVAPPGPTVGTAAGAVSMPIYTKHNFLVDGVSVIADVVFASALGHAPALCGRIPLLQCSSKIGLRAQEWLRQ